MYYLRFSLFVYYCCCFDVLVMPIRCFDLKKKKTMDNIKTNAVDTCSAADNVKIRKMHNLTREHLHSYAIAQWDYHTDRNENTTRLAVQSTIQLFLYQKLLVTYAKNLSENFSISYSDLLPLIYFVRDHGVCLLESKDFKTAIKLKSKLMTTINGIAACEYQKSNVSCNITADEIKFIMSSSSDVPELKYYWKAWHNYTAFVIKSTYTKYIGVLNLIAKLNNVSDEIEYYGKPYKLDGCLLNIEQLYEEIRPLYLNLHSYVRKILRAKYGSVTVSHDGPIPVHLLGSVLGQPWTNILPSIVNDMITPVDYGENMTSKVSSKRSYDHACSFFTSIGLGTVPKSVWSKSVFEVKEKFADCKASSWDMYSTKDDFRIKMCFRDTFDDVATMHKLLGLVHYYSAYKKQPINFQNTPDTVFVDAMMNALTLSVKYQEFIIRYNCTDDSKLVFLMRMGFEKVAVLPYAYAADVWHAGAFRESFPPKRMNEFWWSNRLKYEGVVSPISKGMDKFADSNYKPFDPSASYRTLTELPPIKSVMSKGSSTKWLDLYEMIVGHRKLHSEPLLEYFQPLLNYLRLNNVKSNEFIGWKN